MSKAKAKLKVNWSLDEKSWKTLKFDPKKIGSEAIKKTLDHLDIRSLFPYIEISVLLADDQKLQELNYDYRGKNKPTNVLSFPVDLPLKAGKDLYLGDIAISFQTLYDESLEQQKSFQDHYTHMLVHSTLHLLGHDHEKKNDAKIMENLEKTILHSFNIKDPYE